MQSVDIVIFSSGAQKRFAQKIGSSLDQFGFTSTIWCDLFTRKDKSANFALLPTLLKKIPTFDFAIILGGADDVVSIHRAEGATEYKSMRDNVIFETGLAIMALGQNKTILIAEDGVRLFDDLVGIDGIYDMGYLSANSLGIKCINYNYDIVKDIIPEIVEYISQQMDIFSPVVIGASCSTAIGYYDMFIKRCMIYCEEYADLYKEIEINILIPNYITHDLHDKISQYYKESGLSKMELNIENERTLSFFGKVSNHKLSIYDIPTTIGTSYETAAKILSIDAADIEDDENRIRFLRKESTTFYHTIKRLIDENNLLNVNIKQIIL